MPLAVAAVLVTYNRQCLLAECLEALLKQTRPLERIILVDNASTDGTAEWLLAQGYLHHPRRGSTILGCQKTGAAPVVSMSAFYRDSTAVTTGSG
jgi:glycosyltransferase involved in cell wall biosynthesis